MKILFNEQEKIPDCKLNQVAFLPFLPFPKLTKTTLAISKNYICYTVKNKQIRVIDQHTTDKALLSGHQNQPLDMKFSNIDANIIGTVDVDDNDSTKGNVYIWTIISENDNINTKLSHRYEIPANIIVSHPNIPSVWAVGYAATIGIISTKTTKSLARYGDLSLYGRGDGVVLEVGFTHDKKGIFGLFQGNSEFYLDYWVLPSDNLLELGEGSLTKMYSSNGLTSTSIPRAISAVSTSVGIVTLSSSTSEGTFEISVWKDSQTGIGPVTQTVTIVIPLVNNDPANLMTEASLITINPENNFVIFAHRRSRAIACLALNPKSPYTPIVHVTFLDLTNPVTFVMAKITTGRNHHSEEEVDHIDISCLQIVDKSIINQYLIPVNNIRKPLQEYSLTPSMLSNTINFSSSLSKDDGLGIGLGSFNRTPSPNLTINPTPAAVAPQQGRSILSMLMGGIGIASTPPATVPDADLTQSKSQASVQLQLQEPVQLQSSVPITHLLSSLNGNSAPIVAPSDVAQDGLPDILKTGPVQNRSLLQMVGGNVKSSSIPGIPPPISEVKQDLTTPFLPSVPVVQQIPVSQPSIAEATKVVEDKKEKKKSNQKEDKTVTDTSNQNKDSIKNLVNPVGNKAEVSSLSKETIKSLKSEIVADVLKGMESMIEKEMKKAVENIKKSLKDELGKEISSAVEKDLFPKVKESVKDTVKTSLTSVFRSSFENTLLPAFQAGTDRMFAQVQESFEVGMDGLIEQGKIAHQISSSSNMDLRTQVNALRAAITTMDSKLVELGKRLSNDNVNIEIKPDPMSLLAEGKINDALHHTLEEKSIESLVKLLSKLETSIVNQECSVILRLCTTQQLSSDLAKNEPIEGISTRLDWLKGLTLSLIDSNDSKVIQILSMVYNNLQTASSRESHVDLMMLMTILKSRI